MFNIYSLVILVFTCYHLTSQGMKFITHSMCIIHFYCIFRVKNLCIIIVNVVVMLIINYISSIFFCFFQLQIIHSLEGLQLFGLTYDLMSEEAIVWDNLKLLSFLVLLNVVSTVKWWNKAYESICNYFVVEVVTKFLKPRIHQ